MFSLLVQSSSELILTKCGEKMHVQWTSGPIQNEIIDFLAEHNVTYTIIDEVTSKVDGHAYMVLPTFSVTSRLP